MAKGTLPRRDQGCSKNKLQSELHAPRGAERADLAEYRAGDIGAGEPQRVNPVQSVERFEAELQARSLLDGEVFEERCVEVEEARPANGITAGIAWPHRAFGHGSETGGG